MQELFPSQDDSIDVWQCHADDDRPGSAEHPWVFLNMITSLDGATAAGGRSGGLNGPADKAVFMALRAVADVILVGAGTARAESYGPPSLPETEMARRRARGQAELPRLAIVSNRMSLEPEQRVFDGAGPPPYVVTTGQSDADRRTAIGPMAEILIAGRDSVDIAEAVGQLGRDGARVILCEGGPTLNASLLAADLIDELCLTFAPVMVGGESHRLVHGARNELSRQMELRRILEQDGYLFLRYTRA